MSHLDTAESPIHGIGVFSSIHFSPGQVVLRIDDSRVVTDANPLDPAHGELDHHCDYLASGEVVLMQSPERFINHRCEPNTYIRTIAGDRYVVALREVHSGDEITYDYCINGDGDTAWTCSCGSPSCRKYHLFGFFHRSIDFQARNLALLEDWFIAEHRDKIKELKRHVEASFEAILPADETSLRGEDPTLGVEGTDLPAVSLMVDPPLGWDEAAMLFRSAWGDDAPDSPPAVDRCLTHIGAYDGERLVGFVKLAWDGGDHAFVLDTTVHPDHQRRGIGRLLIRRAADVAERNGVEWLHVDYEPHLEDFYARCGFRPTSAGLIRLGNS